MLQILCFVLFITCACNYCFVCLAIALLLYTVDRAVKANYNYKIICYPRKGKLINNFSFSFDSKDSKISSHYLKFSYDFL